MLSSTLRIALLGPESSGKSTLAAALAERLDATCVPEYARDYIYGLNLCYTYEDVCHIAEQNRREWQDAEGLTFFDTDSIITRVWLDVEFGQHPEWLDEMPPMDYYLLCFPDTEAVPEPIRTNASPEARMHYFEVYQEEVRKTGRPYGVVSGLGESRLQAALSILEGWGIA